ncbi:uncharacterized protein PODANS_4_5780 [Podospora anserina S mat+]|uniref:Podospora anserina S mat+ genomic DNA chromosome 4, supercontig 4 n=1 Tax=Podospora anserina (strain S / ATCC MYA-4624 / DSM 980 / FGSC 10383) TaxID=515849 RepID=B2APZ7_PODAN|nr:uncharacterized protein PODANS_4_5780 [Podospora anserina S mat+]CAP66936.1 unnamed protein product [Podospora anserina S mat+]CDP28678.1 Putative protein of unknown function [Podospora anserina S mat+]
MSRQYLLTILAVLATASSINAQILSCADVECPITKGTTSATCTVVDKIFNAVGVVPCRRYQLRPRIRPVIVPRYSSLGVRLPASCAVFFNKVNDRVRFGDDDPKRSKGTCNQAMTDGCINALIKRALEVDLSGNDACEKLQTEFLANLDSECASFATGNNWVDVTAVDLLGDGSPQPIDSDRNASSDCWPTSPRNNDLRLVHSTNSTTSVSQAEAQLTCVKAIDLTTTSNATQTQAEGTSDAIWGSGVSMVLVGIMTVVFAAMLA